MFMKHEFVECIPEALEDRTVYISLKFKTVVHRCPCGCGSEIVTPLSPAEWEFTFNGDTISLHPSVGNWSLPCRSHYWIHRGRVRWARSFTPDEIETVRSRDESDREEWYSSSVEDADAPLDPKLEPSSAPNKKGRTPRR